MVKRDFRTDEMMDYMERKYREKFDFVEGYAGQTGKDYIMILLKSRQYSDDRQALVRMVERQGKLYYEDNYLAHLLKDKLEEIEGAIACQCFGECKLCYKLPEFVFPSCFHAGMPAEEFLGNQYAMPRFFIVLENRELRQRKWEEKVHKFRKLNSEKGFKIRGTIKLDADRIIFSIDESGSFRYMRWLSGSSASGDRKEGGAC